MKKSLNILFIALIGISLIFTSCTKDEENDLPVFSSVVLSTDNSTITVTFSEAVYGKADKTGNLDETDFSLTIISSSEVQATYNVAHTAGESTVVISLEFLSVISGDETIKISPADGISIYDADGAAMAATESMTTEALTFQAYGIVGKWYSSGDNVAVLLSTYFYADSIYAEFKIDGTYLVHQFNEGNESGTPDVIYNGTYTMEKSTVGEIWNIVIVQVDPYAADASGIFEIRTGPEVLWYEVVQTSGTENVPPTASGGFGSTNGGSLGDWNVQKYIRITE